MNRNRTRRTVFQTSPSILFSTRIFHVDLFFTVPFVIKQSVNYFFFFKCIANSLKCKLWQFTAFFSLSWFFWVKRKISFHFWNYSVYEGFGQLNLVKFAYGGLILGWTNFCYCPGCLKKWCSLHKRSKETRKQLYSFVDLNPWHTLYNPKKMIATANFQILFMQFCRYNKSSRDRKWLKKSSTRYE